MTVINEAVIYEILSTLHTNTDIRILDWNVNNTIIKPGDNYLSEVSGLIINYLENGEKKLRKIVLKIPSNTPTYDVMKKYNIYDKEVSIYSEILPQLYAICNEEYFTPELYLIRDVDSLFLKDLTASGYKSPNRLEQLDFEHCFHAVKYLAKLHALSVKLEKTAGIPDSLIKECLEYENAGSHVMQNFLSGIHLFIDNVLGPEIKDKYSQQIEFLNKINVKKILEEMSSSYWLFNVLNHGDYWTSNLLFKYDKYGTIKKMKMVDFQLCRWASPVLDLVFFAITSMKFEVYLKYFDLLLEVYLNKLNAMLKSLGCETYEMSDLQKDVKKLCYFIIFTIAGPLAIIFNHSDEVDNEVEENDDMIQAMFKSHHFKTYIKIATKWFLHFADKGAFDKGVK